MRELTVEEMPASTRRYPYVGFQMDREPGKEILTVEDISKTVDGVKGAEQSFISCEQGDKIAFVGENDIARIRLYSKF